MFLILSGKDVGGFYPHRAYAFKGKIIHLRVAVFTHDINRNSITAKIGLAWSYKKVTSHCMLE